MGGPAPTRPVASAGKGQNDHMSEIVSHLLEPVANYWDGGMEVNSTPDMLSRIDRMNDDPPELELIDIDEVDRELDEMERAMNTTMLCRSRSGNTMHDNNSVQGNVGMKVSQVAQRNVQVDKMETIGNVTVNEEENYDMNDYDKDIYNEMAYWAKDNCVVGEVPDNDKNAPGSRAKTMREARRKMKEDEAKMRAKTFKGKKLL